MTKLRKQVLQVPIAEAELVKLQSRARALSLSTVELARALLRQDRSVDTIQRVVKSCAQSSITAFVSQGAPLDAAGTVALANDIANQVATVFGLD